MILEYLLGGSNLNQWASTAHDSQVLLSILQNFPKSDTINAEDAGTVARFMTSLCATVPHQIFTLHGTKRMHERPIGALVEALRQLEVEIEYLENEDFLPIKIYGKKINKMKTSIRLNESSQFLSSLLLLTPLLPLPFRIETIGNLVSTPYVEMTINLLSRYGYSIVKDENSFRIKLNSSTPLKSQFEIEGDWSAAFYFLFINDLTENSSFKIDNLQLNSIQGDRYVDKALTCLGLQLTNDEKGVGLERIHVENPYVQLDFSKTPDLAQPFICYCVARRIIGKFTGLQTLRNKETDRINALQTELKKLGVELSASSSEIYIRRLPIS